MDFVNRPTSLRMMSLTTFLSVCLVHAVASAGPPKPAAKRAVSVADADNWKSIRSAQVSDNGRWFAYILSPAKGDAEVVVRQTDSEKERRFPVGAVSPGRLAFSSDSQWVAFVVYPNAKEAKQSAQAKKPPKTKVSIVNLESDKTVEIENGRSITFSGEQAGWIAIRTVSASGTTAGKAGPSGTDLLLHELATGRELNFGNVSEYAFNKSGVWLAVVIDATGKAGNGVQLFHLGTGVVRPIEGGKARYSKLTWNKKGDALTVLKSVEDASFEQPLLSAIGWRQLDRATPQKVVVDPKELKDFPKNMTISPSRAPTWSEDGTLLLFGIHAITLKKDAAEKKEGDKAGATKDVSARDKKQGGKKDRKAKPGDSKRAPKKDTGKTATKDPKTELESATSKKSDEKPPELVIWHWKDERLQSQQQKEEKSDKSFSFLCSYEIEPGKFTRLATAELRTVVMSARHRWAIGVDDRAYKLDGSLDGRRFRDVHVIDPRSGERWLALKKCRWYFGSSPDASRLLFYEDGHYFTYDVVQRKKRSLTKNLPVSFVDTEDDHNQVKPPIRPIGWSKDGTIVLLHDDWDIWAVPADGGQATNLTENGRKDKVRYRRPFRLDPEQRDIDLDHDIYVSVYGEWTKKGGIGRIKPGRPGVELVVWDDAQYGRLIKARRDEVYLFTRETSTQFANYHVTDSTFQKKTQITDANKQQEQFLWSSGSRLVDFTSAQGKKLQAALFLPAGYRKGKRYPTIVYIYEKLSSRLNTYSTPRIGGFSRSLYTSNGFAVLMPDITYQINDPGLSAVRCVLPAIDAAVKTGVVDSERVGLHGHSWGGYQTAFLITQTNRFKGAVAGAPLTNLVSMYSSIYWNSGSANQPIFESSQGRFQGGYWEHLDDYMRNSPIHYAPQVSTPLLLLHNDADGAVDWNQGIEYFNALRRLRKPVVMLQYKGENHGLARRENRRDYSVRMLEFFEHTLRQKPAPKWWSKGVSHLDLPEYLKQRAQGTSDKSTQ